MKKIGLKIRRFFNQYCFLMLLLLTSEQGICQTPTISFTTVNDTFYTFQNVVFTNTSTGFTSNTTFTWDFNDASCEPLNGSIPINCIDYSIGLDSVKHSFSTVRKYENSDQVSNATFCLN